MVKRIRWKSYCIRNTRICHINISMIRNKQSIQEAILQKYPMFGIQPAKSANIQKQGIKPPGWIMEGPIYEIYVRSFSEEGTFSGVEKRIRNLKDLGIKTIWLMPIHPIGKESRKGNLGSPYAILDHKAVNPEYGTVKDFQYLVDAIHDHNMCIIIDMVLNHSAKDHILYPDSSKMFNHSFQHSPPEWTDVREFNYDSESTRKYASEVLKYWVKEFGIDGYRCDVAGLIPLDFWEEAVNQILNINPDLYMLAEWQSRDLHNKAFHSTYDWTLYLIMKEVAAGSRPASDIIRWQLEQKSSYPGNALPLRFTENHDLPRTVTTFGQDRLYPYIFYLYSIPGIPLVYNGQELGDSKLLSLFEHNTINWEKKNHQIFKFLKRLIHLRNTNDVFRCGNIEIIQIENEDQILAMRKRTDNKQYDFYLNFSSSEYPLNFDRNYINAKSVQELVENTTLTIPNGFVVGPFQSAVFKIEQDETSNL